VRSRRPRGRQGRVHRIVAVVVLTTLWVLAGCSEAAPREGSHGSSTSSARTVPTTQQLPSVTPVGWSPCGSDLQCGSVTVPLDYSRPAGPAIQIALERHPADTPEQRIGSLVINPGGPGGSGIDDLPEELSVLTPELLDDFDIVSFDPRGVERSDPVKCGSGGAPSDNTTPLPDPAPETSEVKTALVSSDRQYASQCEQDSGSVLPHVGTVAAAMDLDRIRAALGDPRLTFIGHSYGTLLGATYAQMFPTHVRAMVLDGAIDPAMDARQMVLDQAEGFESVLGDFFSWCTATPSSCSWHPSGDPTASLLDLVSQSRRQPLPAGGGRSAGPGEIYEAILSGMYATSYWPALGRALGEAAAGDGAAVVSMSDAYRRNGASNGSDAGQAIFCLDHPVPRDISAYPLLAAADAMQAPVFGPMLAWGLAGCAVWPVPPTRTVAPTTATGSPPILVTGATKDPATPYQWAENLAHELRQGVLLTWEGQSHVAYYYSSCVRQIDQAYLVAGTLPGPGTVCSD
jgi:pimeloyl-ACP methyl ester carboxylesterase